eukprot:3920941-Amphidinium_carterae.1
MSQGVLTAATSCRRRQGLEPKDLSPYVGTKLTPRFSPRVRVWPHDVTEWTDFALAVVPSHFFHHTSVNSGRSVSCVTVKNWADKRHAAVLEQLKILAEQSKRKAAGAIQFIKSSCAASALSIQRTHELIGLHARSSSMSVTTSPKSVES